MKFEEVLRKHLEFKIKIKMYSIRKDNSLTPAIVGVDNQCELGKWIYGEGKQYSVFPEYDLLKAEHTKFHKVTAKIVELINNKKEKEAQEMLNPKNEFGQFSGNCVKFLYQLKQKAAKKDSQSVPPALNKEK